MNTLLLALLIIVIVLLIVLIVLVLVKKNKGSEQAQVGEDVRRVVKEEVTSSTQIITTSTQASMKGLGDLLQSNQQQFGDSTKEQMRMMTDEVRSLSENNERRLMEMQKSIAEGMTSIRTENNQRLAEIRETVDEKLQSTLEKRIAESFNMVNTQLEQVYKGLGEMQTLASDVGGLKKVLSGVKTRGILGEIQLSAILHEIMSPSQFDENVATVPNSTERVEFAIKLPGADEDSFVYLPIDSKFPGDTYMQLREAQESGDKKLIEAAYKNLETVIKLEAKDIHDKYLFPPYTTTFGIMFLPFEGLYSEVVNRGLMEELQRKYQINIAGPSTMAAILNSLQMGFRTLAIQKRSHEVWEVLGAVKTEFGKFEEVLRKMQGHLNQTSKDLDTLIGTRTNAINRKLRDVQTLDVSVSPMIEMLEGDDE